MGISPEGAWQGGGCCDIKERRKMVGLAVDRRFNSFVVGNMTKGETNDQRFANCTLHVFLTNNVKGASETCIAMRMFARLDDY